MDWTKSHWALPSSVRKMTASLSSWHVRKGKPGMEMLALGVVMLAPLGHKLHGVGAVFVESLSLLFMAGVEGISNDDDDNDGQPQY